MVISLEPAIAQQATPGYIVRLDGDTLKGFILEGTDFELEQAVNFKKSLNESGVTPYTSQTILGFGFDYGRKFKRFTFSKSDTDPNDSSPVLAKEVLVGKINFYTWERSRKGEPDIFLTNNYSHQSVHLIEPEKESVTEAETSMKVFPRGISD